MASSSTAQSTSSFEMVKLTINVAGRPAPVLLEMENDPEATASDLKALLEVETGILSGEQRLVYLGRLIKDGVALSDLLRRGNPVLYLSKVPAVADRPSSPALQKSPTADLGGLAKMLMAGNPELLQSLMLSNPRMQAAMRRNPQLRHTLSDPSTMQDLLAASTNPKAYQEMMRGHDLALSNLENIPEGFQYLRSVYSELERDDLDEEDGIVIGRKKKPTSPTNQNHLNVNPMPNPWSSSRWFLKGDDEDEETESASESEE